jgi:hypothetical protein
MRKSLALFLLFTLYCLFGQRTILFAQDNSPGYDETIPDGDDDGDMPDADWGKYIPDMYTRGDQIFAVSAATIFPVVFFNNGKVIKHNFDPPVGGVLSLAYHHFLGAHFFVGGELGIKFNYTLGQNTVFIFLIGGRGGWQFVYRRFEFPIYAGIGMSPQRYLNAGYFGMYLKGGGAAYYRFNPNWSFGISTDWNWYPQWPMKDGKRTPDKDIYANIIGVMLSARYHF